MNRPRFKRRGNLKPAAEQLIQLAIGLVESGSRIEDHYWEAQLSLYIDRLLASKDEESLNSALEHLYETNAPAHEALADCIESCAESPRDLSAEFEILLLASPLLAWSRFRIPTGSIPSAVQANLRTHLLAHVLSADARIAMADFVFSPDQLPQGYCATAELARELGNAVLAGSDLSIDSSRVPDTAHFLSDIRYVLAGVAVPKGKPFFVWQEPKGSRKQALERWQNQIEASLTPLFVGCTIELILPETYFAASRQADRYGRSHSIRASVAFLDAEFNLPVTSLRAVIAPFYDHQLEEYRIGFAANGSEDVIHGVVWPLLGVEDENAETVTEIETILRACGISDIIVLDTRFPMEYCDDCDAPLYPSPEGEIVHAEMPEDHIPSPTKHLH